MMKSGQYLGQKQTTQQRLSPQQIQYIKMLQLPSVALEQRVKDEMESNPLLEEADQNNNEEVLERKKDETEEEFEPEPVDEHDEIDWDEFSHEDEINSYKTGNYNPDQQTWRDLPNPYHQTILEELEEQVALLDLDETEKLIAAQILGSLDSDGYFRRDIDALIDNIAFNHGKMVSEETVENVRHRIQTLDPPGMASVDLRDCLLVQLEQLPGDIDGLEIARKMLRDNWELFERKHFSKLKQKLGIDDKELKAAYHCLKKLDPKPGAGGESPTNVENYIEPDFEVYYEMNAGKSGDEGDFVISLNNKNIPPLRISPEYKKMWENLKTKDANVKDTRKTKKFIKDKMESARWFIESIRQRQHTLLLVMKTIVALQEEFFRTGESLKPMIMKDIAERIDMDISTISRVVNGKYVQTNFGVFELKYFFSEGISTDNGEDVSATEVKNKLLEIVDDEDKQNPLSDKALAEELKKLGYNIARRTISKYREQLNIPVARLRKQIA